MVVQTVTYMTQLLPFVITSPLHNKHNGVTIGNY